MLGEVKERGEHPGHVSPVVGIVGLYDEDAASDERFVHVGQQLRCEHAQKRLAWVVVWLRMIDVDFGDALRSHVACHEGLSILDGEACIMQAALIARRVAYRMTTGKKSMAK